MNRCSIPGCSSERKNVLLHKFPKTLIGIQKWLNCIKSNSFQNLSFENLQKLHVCHEHFEKRMTTGIYLRRTAYPTLFTRDEIETGKSQTVLQENRNKQSNLKYVILQDKRTRLYHDHTYSNYDFNSQLQRDEDSNKDSCENSEEEAAMVRDINAIKEQYIVKSTLTEKHFEDEDNDFTECYDEQNMENYTLSIDDMQSQVTQVIIKYDGEEVLLEDYINDEQMTSNVATTVIETTNDHEITTNKNLNAKLTDADGVEITLNVETAAIDNEYNWIIVKSEQDGQDLYEIVSQTQEVMAMDNGHQQAKKMNTESPEETMARFKASPLPQRDNTLDKTLFTVTRLSYDEQIAEMEGRKESESYKWAPWKCTECYQVFPEMLSKVTHMIKHDEQSGPYQCFICKQRYKNRNRMRTHLLNCHTERISCNVCPYATTSSCRAKTHERFHAGVKFQCSLCRKEFLKETSYLSHLRLKHVSSFVCELCGFAFVNRSGVNMHKRRAHANELNSGKVVYEGPFCEACDVRFLSTEAYARHLRLSACHASDSDPNRPANSFHHERLKHLKQLHDAPPRPRERVARTERAGPVTCEQCDETLPHFQAYSHHFSRRHPEQNPTQCPSAASYVCEHCGKLFLTYVNYKDHSWVHTGVKNHRCDICNKSFSSKSNMYGHVRAHKFLRRTHPCPVCNKHFHNSSNRKRHMLIHTGVKAFQCTACGKRFTTETDRRSHYDHVHLRKPWPKRANKRAPARARSDTD